MKTINNFITEKLKLNTSLEIFKYKPTSRRELKNIILKEIKEHGNDVNLNSIDTSKIEDMTDLFAGCAQFCGNVSMWNVSNVKKMTNMFSYCENFNSDISKWNVSQVENFDEMFLYCKSFSQDLNNWEVKDNASMTRMFSFTPKQKKPRWYKS